MGGIGTYGTSGKLREPWGVLENLGFHTPLEPLSLKVSIVR